MKKLFAAVALAAMALMTGCKSLPTTDQMYTAAQAVGYTSGLIANETKIDDKSRDTIIEVVTIVKGVVPAEGQSFVDAWNPIAKDYAAKLVEKGKLTEDQAALVCGGVNVAALGLDYVFTVYPKAKLYEELVSAAMSGFAEGFLTTFKPVDLKAPPKAIKKTDFDKDAYVAIKAALKK